MRSLLKSGLAFLAVLALGAAVELATPAVASADPECSTLCNYQGECEFTVDPNSWCDDTGHFCETFTCPI